MLRDVVTADLPIFHQHQLDPEATRMAAFPAREQWSDFLAHWESKVLCDPTCGKQTIVWNGEVAGNVLSWPQEGLRLVGYWLGRAYWGRGIATAALAEYLRHDLVRPLHAYVAAHNVASIRVLEKCGFVRVGDAHTAPDGIEEYLYRFE
jgi:RimJ/RimL family protein N-acetyltransferase